MANEKDYTQVDPSTSEIDPSEVVITDGSGTSFVQKFVPDNKNTKKVEAPLNLENDLDPEIHISGDTWSDRISDKGEVSNIPQR